MALWDAVEGGLRMRRVLVMVIVLTSIISSDTRSIAANAAEPVGTAAQTVRGTVNDALGRPLSNVAVMLQASDGHVVAQTTTSDTGEFSFAGVATGNYAVIAEKRTFKKATAVVGVGTKPPPPVVLAMESS